MIKDFVPARTSLASGIVVKQHLLERNKYPQPQLSFENKIYTGSINMVEISGSTGGMLNKFNGTQFHPLGSLGNGPNNRFDITQSWSETVPTLSGSTTKVYSNQDEFYDGEFNGSHITISTQNLNIGCDPYKKINPRAIEYSGVRIYSSSQNEFSTFINENNHPTKGYISIWFQRPDSNALPINPSFPDNK